MTEPLRVLIVEDSEDDALLVLRELRKGGFEPRYERVDTRPAMEAALDRQPWDLVLADHSMPNFSSHGAIEVVKRRGLDLPIIVVSGTMTEDDVVRALKAGAHDFIVKGRFARLVPAVKRELADTQVRRERTEAERARLESQAQLRHLASHDQLTDLPNRALFRDHLQRALQCHRAPGGSVAVHFLDLDEFKRVNDTLGHAVGDDLLKLVAERLRGCVRARDVVSRFSGDEFGIVQTNVTCPEEAAGMARRVCEVLSRPARVAGHELTITVSIGITLAPSDGTTPEQLLKNADLALYEAKRGGRSTFHFFTEELNARMQSRVALENDLRQALQRGGGLVLHYQPQVDLCSGATVGMEALVRWQHPARGLLRPAEFISIAEDSGLIVPLTAWVLREACRQQRAWHPCRMAVNVSPSHLDRDDLVAAVRHALDESGMGSEFLEVEITEGLLLKDTAKALETLNRVHALGVSIAIDDFGTGYSSLSYLRQLPINRLKIDMSFVQQLNGTRREHLVIDAIITLGHKLGMQVLGEGVESEQHVAYLKAQGCDEAQGFFYHPPAPAAELGHWIRGAAVAGPETSLAR